MTERIVDMKRINNAYEDLSRDNNRKNQSFGHAAADLKNVVVSNSNISSNNRNLKNMSLANLKLSSALLRPSSGISTNAAKTNFADKSSNSKMFLQTNTNNSNAKANGNSTNGSALGANSQKDNNFHKSEANDEIGLNDQNLTAQNVNVIANDVNASDANANADDVVVDPKEKEILDEVNEIQKHIQKLLQERSELQQQHKMWLDDRKKKIFQVRKETNLIINPNFQPSSANLLVFTQYSSNNNNNNNNNLLALTANTNSRSDHI